MISKSLFFNLFMFPLMSKNIFWLQSILLQWLRLSLLNRLTLSFFCLDYTFIPTKRNNKLLMYKKYTYYSHQRGQGNKYVHRWFCSSQTKGCKAKLSCTIDGTIIPNSHVHNHDPPNYRVTKSGEYVLIPLEAGISQNKHQELITIYQKMSWDEE